MSFLDKLNNLAENSISAIEKSAKNISSKFEEKGVTGILDDTTDSLIKAGNNTKNYFTSIVDDGKKITESIPEKDLESSLAKITAVVMHTSEKVGTDFVNVSSKFIQSISKNFEESTKPSVKSKKLFLSDGQIAELDCMPIELVIKNFNSKSLEHEHTYTINLSSDEDDSSVFLFVTKNQKWVDLNSGEKGIGSISFISHYLSLVSDIKNKEDLTIKEELTNSSHNLLSKISELDDYKVNLKKWIQIEKAKAILNTPDVVPTKEEPTVKKTRTVKPKVKVSEESTSIKKPVRKAKTVTKTVVKKETEVIADNVEEVKPKRSRKKIT